MKSDPIYIIIVLSILFVFQVAGQRSLITFSETLSHHEISIEVKKSGGIVMVYWPGHAWVRWENENEGLLLNSEIIEKVDFEGYKNWASTISQAEMEPIECATDEYLPVERTVKLQKGTSDTLKGHTVCAAFFVNQTQSVNPWTLQDQQLIMQNAAVNLTWWVEQALLYGVEASFEIVPYFYDDPVCQVSVDPTLTTNRSWVTEIMNALGYTDGSNTERETAYVMDLIAGYESDWGFITYFIRGGEGYRSNAALFGPSTTNYYLAARTGFTFAHEVGHIFGLRDEYEERAIYTYKFELNDLPNLNADFRNLINAPCLMKVSSISVGLCCYNPIHLHWTDELREFEVLTEPSDAIFAVQYQNTITGAAYQTRYHQGYTRLPMGLGMRAKLMGLNDIQIQDGRYENPIWDISGQSEAEVTIETDGPQSAYVSYQFSEPAEQFVAFLNMGEHYMGRRIQHLSNDGETVLTLTNQGISTFNDQGFQLFEAKWEIRPGIMDTTFRVGSSYELLDKGEWLIGGQIGASRPQAVHIKEGIEIASYLPPESFRTIGGYSAVCKTANDYVLAAFSEGNLHRYAPDGTWTMLGVPQGLPDPNISALAAHPNGIVWMGYDGGRTGDGFTGLYLLNPSNWSFQPPNNIPAHIQNARISSIRFFDDGATILIVSADRIFIFEFGEWNALIPFEGSVAGADRIGAGRWVIAGSGGVHYHNEEGVMIAVNQTNSTLQENFVRTVTSMPDGVLMLGHANYGVSAIYTGELQVATEENIQSAGTITYYPNPVSNGTVFVKSEEITGDVTFSLWNLFGQQVAGVKSTLNQDGTSVFLGKDHAPGIYVLRVEGAANGTLGLLKIVD